MLNRGDRGPAVTELQRELLALGYGLPRFGADGSLGNETLDAMTHFLADHEQGYHDDDINAVSDQELAFVARVTEAMVPLPPQFFDQRFAAAQAGIGGRRTWNSITGICLHQTDCDFGHEGPTRWDTLHAHVGISREDFAVWVHDFQWVVWHANELNPTDVGVECEGVYPGVMGDPKAMVVTPELVDKAQVAIRWICAVVAAHGGKIVNLHAHRQTAASRRADPGAEIWQRVAIPMLAELGLSDGGPAFKIDNGRVIPEVWNPAYVGNAY